MKKVIVVSKTHLDLGFTDFAEVIRRKYIDSFIPGAVALAEQVNTPEKKRFVWTTGSWILKEALRDGTPKQKQKLLFAIKRGDIAPHAMPFTTHTELLDEDTLDYGLSIVDTLDELRGRKTVAAKVTDVPGHTKGLVRQLAKHGIKLLHIGVNGSSRLPDVPECFLWRVGDAEVVVIYSADYGGAFQSDVVEEVLYFDHTLDNHGAPAPTKILEKFSAIEQKFPGYTVEAGTMDDFADVIWEARDKLPVFTGELGDTWIHGAATDPYKAASLRTLQALKRRWLTDGSMTKDSREYADFTDAAMCIAEHTCGLDSKKYLSDYENYLKKDFRKARKRDIVKMRHPFRDFPQNPQNIYVLGARIGGGYAQGSYRRMEESWAEQRGYIAKAVSALSEVHRHEVIAALDALMPKIPAVLDGRDDPFRVIKKGDWAFQLNRAGGVGLLRYRNDDVVRPNDKPVLTYRSFSNDDYDFWLTHYSRNVGGNKTWVYGDFARPYLSYVKDRYPTGRFPYRLKKASVDPENARILVDLVCDKVLNEELGAPRLVQILYTLTEQGLQAELSWFGKDANRLPEALYFHLFPSDGELRLNKLGCLVAPDEVVLNGGRNLHAVLDAQLTTPDGVYRFINEDAPLISVGKGKILEFDNKFEDFRTDGVTYVLHNNVWGTNFPLWYGENARFRFDITTK